MILITSASYINHGLASEFGAIPSCMVPVQNRLLIEHQINLINKYNGAFGDIYVSLPKGYILSDYDAKLLADNKVKIIYIDDCSLSKSIYTAICEIEEYYMDVNDKTLYILHGDTLFDELPTDADCYLYYKNEDEYAWDYADNNNVYCGFFSFSDIHRLTRTLIHNNKFIDAVTEYGLHYGILAKSWLDFGSTVTYYRSISKMTTQRSFNSLVINDYAVTKTSKDTRKMEAESNWLLNIPGWMKHYAPAVWDAFDGGYTIEYFYLSSLASLFVYSRLSVGSWKSIIDSCMQFLHDENKCKPSGYKRTAEVNNLLFTSKTRKRLNEYAKSSSLDLDKEWVVNHKKVGSINSIIDELDTYIQPSDENTTRMMHGDFCFSNILYDFRSKSVKVIDPRGISADGKELSIYGDIRYDVAKLAHSIIGKYDYIIANRFTYKELAPYTIEFSIQDTVSKEIEDYFINSVNKLGNVSILTMYAVMINLFLSMIPLHSDNPARQQAMLANALRLYIQFKTLV